MDCKSGSCSGELELIFYVGESDDIDDGDQMTGGVTKETRVGPGTSGWRNP